MAEAILTIFTLGVGIVAGSMLTLAFIMHRSM